MSPTMELRWIERNVIVQELQDGTAISKIEKVLQQKWEGYDDTGWPVSKWRDIPVFTEGTVQTLTKIELDDLEGRNLDGR